MRRQRRHGQAEVRNKSTVLRAVAGWMTGCMLKSDNRLKTQNIGTSSAIIALLLWSFYAPVVVFAGGINPFLFAGVLDGVAFLVFLALGMIGRENPLSELRSMPLWFLTSGVIGIGGHDIALAAAFQSAPPLEAALLNYLWPLFLVIFTAAAQRKPLTVYHQAATCLGLAGVAIMLAGRGLAFTKISLCFGHFWALISALVWSAFSVICSRHGKVSRNLLSIIFLVSSSLEILIWLYCFQAPPAPAQSLVIVGFAGIFFTLAYLFWSFGMKRGNIQLIGVASFLTPVAATVYLSILGMAQFNTHLAAALCCIMLAIGIAKHAEKRVRP
jgi:drug/metabolite transporter (DMT)-like permease